MFGEWEEGKRDGKGKLCVTRQPNGQIIISKGTHQKGGGEAITTLFVQVAFNKNSH